MDITALDTPSQPQGDPQKKQLVMTYFPARIEIIDAPDVIEVSLLILQQLDGALHRFIDADTIVFGGEVTYQVIGWDNVKKCLTLGKVV